MTVRVYHPDTDEPFDLTPAKAAHLRLNKGWRAQPVDPNGERAVTTVQVERGMDAVPGDTGTHEWRNDKVGEGDVAGQEHKETKPFAAAPSYPPVPPKTKK